MQAIFARALVLSLAYPQIGPAVNELFDDGGGSEVAVGGMRSPEMDLMSCGELGLGGKTYSFMAIQKILTQQFEMNGMGTAVVIGYFQSANVRKEMVLAPEAFKERLWWNEDMLIVICRRIKLKSLKPESKDGVPALSVLSALSRTNSIEGSAAETPRHCQDEELDKEMKPN